MLLFDGRGAATTVSPIVQHHLLRIVREAITNAIRHGSAKQIGITLDGRSDSVALTVEDDGEGFDVEPLARFWGTSASVGCVSVLDALMPISTSPAGRIRARSFESSLPP